MIVFSSYIQILLQNILLMTGFRGVFQSLLVLYINLVWLQNHHISAQTYLGHSCTGDDSTPPFQSNLNTIISLAPTNINAYGFYNGTSGHGVDRVNAIALCRGDIDAGLCSKCVKNAAIDLTTTMCPNQTEAITWYDECWFRYSNNAILGVMSLVPAYLLPNTIIISNDAEFSQRLHSFAGVLVDKAYNGTFRKYAGLRTPEEQDKQPIYGLMQCTPDLTPDDCKSCLQSIVQQMSACCYDKIGARWITPSCVFRFEIAPFLNYLSNQIPPPPPPSPSPPPLLHPPPTAEAAAPGLLQSGSRVKSNKSGNNTKSKTVIIVVCVIIASLVLIVGFCVFIARRRLQKADTEHQQEEEEEEVGEDDDFEGITQYNFALIRAATNSFSTANMLGKGGFGEVYKGVLSDGKEIAVKRLSTTSVQGENEFRNEVKLLAKLQHNCLVRLLGFCLEQTERLLVYEFMPNGSLDKVLFGDAVNRSRLDWKHRYRIINNVAKGLLYLHEDSRLMIVHRDLKAGNILLDEKMNAKISDFGTARLFNLEEDEANTRRIVGTLGYMAPEYAMYGLFSVKSDVYSYGVLLLEIVTGKRNYYSLTDNNSASDGLLSDAYRRWKEGKALDLIDPMLTASSEDSVENMMRCINIALLCVQDNVGSRPTMASVNLMLQSLTIALPIPFEPGFFTNYTRSWLSEFLESTNQNDPPSTEETDSYLYPR